MLSSRQVRKALLLIAWFSKVRENEVRSYRSMTEQPGIVHIHTEVSISLFQMILVINLWNDLGMLKTNSHLYPK